MARAQGLVQGLHGLARDKTLFLLQAAWMLCPRTLALLLASDPGPRLPWGPGHSVDRHRSRDQRV